MWRSSTPCPARPTASWSAASCGPRCWRAGTPPDSPRNSADRRIAMVMFITRFVVKGPVEEFERLFKEHSEFMSSQPGFVDFQMVRSMSDPHVYLNIGQWHS